MIFAEEQLKEVEKITEIVEDVSTNPSLLNIYMQTLPEKLFNLMIRSLFTLIFVLVGYFLTKLIRKAVRKTMQKMKADKGAISFTDSLIKIISYMIIIMIVLVRFGVDAASLVAVIGSLGLTAGLALQGALQNFAGGIIILCIKPFKVGDYISDNKNANCDGTVIDIGLLYTEVLTLDNRKVYLPNGTLANSAITNYTENDFRGIDLLVGISYQSDVKRAKAVAMKVLSEGWDFEVKETAVYINDLSDYKIDLRILAKVPTDKYIEYRRCILERIKYSFEEANIEIPFPQMDIYMKS